MSHTSWGLMAFVIGLAGYVPYNVAIFRKTARPRITSWLVWVILDWTSLAGMLVKSEMNGVVLAFSAGALFTLINAWAHAREWQWSKVDRYCLFAAGGALVLWMIDGDPTRAVVIMGIGLMAGNVPTMIHVLKNPKDENLLAWCMYGVSVVCGVFAITEWTIAKATTPVVFAINDGSILLCLCIGFIRNRKKS